MSNQQLVNTRRQLESDLARTDSRAVPGRGPSSGDVCDLALAEMESDLAVEAVNAKWRTAKDVQLALWRLEAATYGVCESCEQPISEGRLSVLPWASRCIQCQAAFEDGHDRNFVLSASLEAQESAISGAIR